MMSGALRAMVLVMIISTACSQRSSEEQRRHPDPFFELRVVTGGSASAVDSNLPVLWILPSAVILGSQRLARVEGFSALEEEGDGRIARAIKGAQISPGRLGLGVDARIPFGLLRPILEASHRSAIDALELRLGPRDNPSGLRVCLGEHLLEGAQRPEVDCWSRSSQAPISADEHSSDASVDSGAGVVVSAPQGDIGEPDAQLRLREALDMTFAFERDFLVLRVQGRTLRTLAFDSGEDLGTARVIEQLRRTLSNFRQSNEWEKRASVRVSPEVTWDRLIALLDALLLEGFEQIAIEI